ncbi:hypothetical protein CDL15_Pgr013236 [Punica granatum]|uniref:Uncharacterized protein n=1 Tax=Punica granatum TaxID=22663 RepID=A0A218WQS5_PUNGR|nr:hypothetical protein CDL15_Pgr013236 [Punica granatum]PKI61221.1 hypothetical protein CRG98_018369 [Punica granatum]
MARERERVDSGPLMLTDLSDDGARCLLEGLSLEFEIAILSYEADMSPSRGRRLLRSTCPYLHRRMAANGRCQSRKTGRITMCKGNLCNDASGI